MVAQRLGPAVQEFGARRVGVPGEELVHRRMGGGVAGGCRVVECGGDLVGQHRNHIRTQRYWPPSGCVVGWAMITPLSPRTSPHPNTGQPMLRPVGIPNT